ncbi:MAG: hypothetical protein U9Q76_05380 [candidate division WOR-3 bacterium]|nr:hypothetical protein [candidate division WOR-3 bacterium]
MSEWKELAHFLYGKGFWYADPIREIKGLTEEQLFWVPNENSLPIIWQVGHIAHRSLAVYHHQPHRASYRQNSIVKGDDRGNQGKGVLMVCYGLTGYNGGVYFCLHRTRVV